MCAVGKRVYSQHSGCREHNDIFAVQKQPLEAKAQPQRQWRPAYFWTIILVTALFSRLPLVAAIHLWRNMSPWRSPAIPNRRGETFKPTASLVPEGASAITGLRGLSQLEGTNVKTFETYEDTVLNLSCGVEFIGIKSARWFSNSNACSAVRDCSEQLKLLCNGRYNCRVYPTGKETTANASGSSYLVCGDVCSTAAYPQRLLRGEYECTAEENDLLLEEAIAKPSRGDVIFGSVNYDRIKEAGGAPLSSEILAAGSIINYYAQQKAVGRNIVTFTDTDIPAIRRDIEVNSSYILAHPESSAYFLLSSSHSVSRLWFTKGAFAALYLAKDASPAILTTVGSTDYGAMLNPETRGYHWKYADLACGVKDAFAISIGLRPRHSGFVSANIVCTNPNSASCANVDVINEAIRKQRPTPVMLQVTAHSTTFDENGEARYEGIACNSNGASFTLLFTDGTVFAFGDPNSGGKMSSSATDALSTFDATRTQRVKKIVTSQRATAVLLLRGSVYAWGEAQYGGVLPSPEPTGVVDIVSNDIGFAALNGEGAVFTWGKGLSVPSRLAGGSVKVVKLYGERTCFAAFDERGGLYVWGLGSDKAPFCSEGFSGGDSTELAFFEDVKADVLEGITKVRFSNNAAVAAREPTGGGSAWNIIGWGLRVSGGKVPSYVLANARKGVKDLQAGDGAFVLQNTQGDIVAWGDAEAGGESWNVDAIRGRVSAVISLSKTFVALLTSGEAFAWGKNGKAILTSAGRNIDGTDVTTLLRGLYVIGGSGGGDIFVGVVGYPCIPSEWGDWSSCKSLCEGIKQRDRTIQLPATTGKCDIPTTEPAKCQGPKYGTNTCPNTGAEAKAENGSDTTTSAFSWSAGSIAGCGVAGLCIVGVVAFMLHTFKRRRGT